MKADKKASKNTFSVIFVIQKGKCRPDGKAPIVARITVNGEMVHFSTKMYIEPERWLPLEYKTKGQTHEEQVINSTLFDFHATIKRKYNDMIYRGEVITASKIKSSILCQDERSMTLIALCNKYIEDYEKLVLTQDYGQESFFRYKVCRNRLQEFLRDEFKVSDLPLQDINKRFLDKLYLWLRSAHRLNNNTAVKFIHRFASIYKMARDNGWVAADPFKQQKLHLDKVDRGYLTIEEVSRLYNKEFESLRLEQVRDIFIFSCYTGLAYIDVYNLTEDQLNVWADGNTWISFHRQKTKVPFNVRLLDVPLQIIEKYKHFRTVKPEVQRVSERDCRSLRDQQEHNFSRCPSHFCHNHYLGKWRANRNRLKDTWAYECAHDTNLRPYHRPENQRRYGESRREAQRNLHCSPDSIQGVCPSRATSA